MASIKNLFQILRNKASSDAQKQEAVTSSYAPQERGSVRALWYDGTEADWLRALHYYEELLRPEQRYIEDYIAQIKAENIEKLDAQGFYVFLYDKYFVWKYTAKNRLATTRMNLEKYMKNDELAVLGDIHSRLFALSKEDIGACLKTASEIRGLGTAGASGLLAVLFPKHFGTVDQFVVKSLQQIKPPRYAARLEAIVPEGIKHNEGVMLVEIMKEKAAELNKKFGTDTWTPRKIDMILWSFGR